MSTLHTLCPASERAHCRFVLRQVRNELAKLKAEGTKTGERWGALIGEEIRLCELLGIEAGPEQRNLFEEAI